MSNRIPILILGGSDRRPGPVPFGLTREQMLAGFKGARRLPWGPCLAGELIERVRESGRFADPILIGPRQVYQGLVDCEIASIEGDLAATLASLRDLVRHRFEPLDPVAFCACDVLPTADEIRRLMETGYDPVAECFFWGQLVATGPEAMGASGWKPSYAVRPAPGEAPVNVYPGHLVIARCGALRMRLTNHLLQLAYRHRNLDLRKRWLPMLARGLGRLMFEYVRNLFRLRPSALSITIPRQCLRAYKKYSRGELTVPDFGDAAARVLLHRDYRGAAKISPVQFAVTPLVSFAKDVDTVAEMDELFANGYGRAL